MCHTKEPVKFGESCYNTTARAAARQGTTSTAGSSPGDVASMRRSPASFAAWTMAQQRPLKVRRVSPLSDSWLLGSPFPAPISFPLPVTRNVTRLSATGTTSPSADGLSAHRCDQAGSRQNDSARVSRVPGRFPPVSILPGRSPGREHGGAGRRRPDKADGPTAGTQAVYPLEFLARLLTHIPNPGQVMMRYYGWYARGTRGMR